MKVQSESFRIIAVSNPSGKGAVCPSETAQMGKRVRQTDHEVGLRTLFARSESLDEAETHLPQPALVGLFNVGPYPSYNWVEIISLAQYVTFPALAKDEVRRLDIRQTGLDWELLKRIADLIPPGGHMMIEYDTPEQRETARSLALGIPPLATPLGYLLYSIGCRAGFKDWYFSEGGSEGPRKLQGYKPLNEEHARERALDLASGLLEFLNRPLDSSRADVEEAARQRAVEILRSMHINHSEPQRAIQKALASQPERTTR